MATFTAETITPTWTDQTTDASGKRPRIDSVDVLRGVIMIIMAIDHVRDYFSNPGYDPTDLSQTSVALFFTRWITHFCAPVFFMLTGTGAYLSLRKQTRSQLSRFLFTRGLWLIVLEFTVTRDFGWQFNFDYRLTLGIVLWALGCSMIVLSVLTYLPAKWVAAFGVVLIAGHNLFDNVPWSSPLWFVLHRPGPIWSNETHSIFVLYPLIPWIGVTAVGFGLGRLFNLETELRRKWLLRLGLGLTAAFVVIRGINRYGDAFHWSVQKNILFTALSFLNTTKYPPSLLYLLMTLGPAILFLRTVDGGAPAWMKPARVIGKVPMFYYVLHIPLIHLVAVAFCYAHYHDAHWMFQSNDISEFPTAKPPGWGYSLAMVYLVWAFVVAALYPLCRWFAALKQRRADVWLSYL
jgi:uncharacterized membrane protein